MFVTTGMGDYASVIGVVIALIGFYITVRKIRRSSSAAEEASKTVKKLREDSIRMDLVAESSTALGLMDQIKFLHRQNEWPLLPDKYTALRKALISVKSIDADLTEEQNSIIQGAVVIIRRMESKVEMALQTDPAKLDVANLNTVISKQMDALQTVLIAEKYKIGR